MNLLKTLWDKLVNKTSVSPTLVIVEEDNSEMIGEILSEILIAQGVRPSEIRNLNLKEKFADWYTGSCTKEGVSIAIADFKKQHGIKFGYE